jgi:integrase
VRRAFTKEETDTILNTAKGEMRMLVAVMMYTGLRLGDACQLKWGDVQKGTVKVKTAKTGAKVAIPLHKRLAKIIGDGKEASSVYVMPGLAKRYTQGKQGRSNVSRSVKRLIERCGIATPHREEGKRDRPDATAHSFRHTFVSRAIGAGVPPHIVQALVGHASAAMTERYSHISDKSVLEAFGRMGGGRKPPEKK